MARIVNPGPSVIGQIFLYPCYCNPKPNWHNSIALIYFIGYGYLFQVGEHYHPVGHGRANRSHLCWPHFSATPGVSPYRYS